MAEKGTGQTVSATDNLPHPAASSTARGAMASRGWRTPARMARRAAPEPRRTLGLLSGRAPWRGSIHPLAWLCAIVAALALGFGLGHV